MKINWVVFAALSLSVSARASSVKCFTKFWGEGSKAEVSASIYDGTKAAKLSLTVNGQTYLTATSKAAVVTKGKYQGCTDYDLGSVKGGGYDGGDLNYLLRLPPNFANQNKFEAIVYLKSQDGYGSGAKKVLCTFEQ